MEALRRLAVGLVGVIGLSVLGVGHAADAVRGMALFANTNNAPLSCSNAACHSGFPSVRRNGISNGSNPTNPERDIQQQGRDGNSHRVRQCD
jgi:hypothetical protein